MPRKQHGYRTDLPIKIVVAIPHKKVTTEFDELSTWSIGIFRRIWDPVEFKITNMSDFIHNFSGNEHYECIIFTLDDISVSEISSYFITWPLKPIIKNCEQVEILKPIIDDFNNTNMYTCRSIFSLTKNISFKLQNNMSKNIRNF